MPLSKRTLICNTSAFLSRLQTQTDGAGISWIHVCRDTCSSTRLLFVTATGFLHRCNPELSSRPRIYRRQAPMADGRICHRLTKLGPDLRRRSGPTPGRGMEGWQLVFTNHLTSFSLGAAICVAPIYLGPWTHIVLQWGDSLLLPPIYRRQALMADGRTCDQFEKMSPLFPQRISVRLGSRLNRVLQKLFFLPWGTNVGHDACYLK